MSKSGEGPRVTVTRNGPYLVSGKVPLARQTIVADAQGGSERWRESDPFPAQEAYALCRCGHSANKPFCDGSHKKTRDENQAETYVYDEAGRVRVSKEY